MSAKLAGKVAVVTGASKGIGAAIAVHLAAEGASVIVNYASSKAGADRVVADIAKKGGKAVAVQADVSKEADITKLYAEATKAFGPTIDILVNNAGVYEFAPLEQVTPAHYHRQFDLNVLGLLLTTKEAAKYFPKGGGNVINISSVVATITPPASSVYSATKAAVDAITHSLAKELGSRGVRVNSINPGLIETEGTTTAGIVADEGGFKKGVIATTPLGRIGQPNEVATAVVFLATDDAKWITNETLNVSGGVR